MSTRTPTPSSAKTARGAARAGEFARTLTTSAWRRVRQESLDVILLAGTTLILVIIGVTMVFSSSTVTSLVETGSPFASLGKQALFAFLGIGLMFVLSSRPERWFMRFAWLALGITSLLQLLVVATPLGITVAGNTNWISIAGVQFQPSEFMKVALVIWLGMMTTRKQDSLDDFRLGVLPILIGAAVPMLLVVIGGDLGTVGIMAGFVFLALVLIGIPMRHFLVPGLVVAAGAVLMAVSSSNRMARILSFVDRSKDANDYLSSGWQVQHGQFALANGGLFGVGIGNSTAKWSWLPAADNDFIFAIIGEELGLIGAVLVLALFGVLCVALVRVFMHADTLFGRTATAAVLVWIMAQAVANIAVVLGIIPVLGVPLPLVSSGGTALVSNLAAIGVVLSVARASAHDRPIPERSASSVPAARAVPVRRR
ncbi:MAG TPA: putative lipid II flippase FtsW [Microbacteriaceae bacterium]|nr:putative lipid II flippase FtsW [Microbacteriaceae bacterium]